MERKQGTVRHLGRCWPSTASLLISSRLDFVLPLDLDGPGRESEADDHAQLSLILIQLTRKSSSSTSSFPSPLPPTPQSPIVTVNGQRLATVDKFVYLGPLSSPHYYMQARPGQYTRGTLRNSTDFTSTASANCSEQSGRTKSQTLKS